MQVKATLNNLRISPRKVRRVASLIRGQAVAHAKIQLEFALQRSAEPLLKLLNSAIANAEHQFQVRSEHLIIKTIYVNVGPTLKRTMPRARGQAEMIRKRSSHITLLLEGQKPSAKVVPKAKKSSSIKKATTKATRSTKKPAKKTAQVWFMSHKVHPIAHRLAIIEDWRSQWFSGRSKKYREYLEQDLRIRELIKSKISDGGIDRVEIIRSRNAVRVRIATARPGLIIGRKGAQIKELEAALKDSYIKTAKKYGNTQVTTNFDFKIDIQEIKEGEIFGQVMAEDIASQLVKRMPTRRVMRFTVQKMMRSPKVQGVKVILSGRLNGAEIAREERWSEGRVPLQTLRANISYGQTIARMPYGAIGIRVWIYRGEVFIKSQSVQPTSVQV